LTRIKFTGLGDETIIRKGREIMLPMKETMPIHNHNKKKLADIETSLVID